MRYPAMTADARARIVRMLSAGHTVGEVAQATGRATSTVRKIRAEEGIKPQLPVTRHVQSPAVVEEPEDSGVGSGDPWMPPAGYDVFAERPNQQAWLELVAAARPWEEMELRQIICLTVGKPVGGSDQALVTAVLADKRTAEELATAYLKLWNKRRRAA